MTAFLTVPELAERWRLKHQTVRDEINRKRLPATKIGGQWLVKPADAEAFETARMNVKRAPAAHAPARTRRPRKRKAAAA